MNKVKKLCIAAIMAALYVGLDFIAVAVSAPFGGTMKISVSGLPVILAAITCGPLWGAAAGFVGAFIGQLVTYGISATTLLWVLPAVVRGLLAGWLFRLFRQSTKSYILALETIISSLAVTAINSIVMYIDGLIYNYSPVVLGISLVNRIIAAVITAIIFAIVLPLLIKFIRKVCKI